ncbi:hypothetical protein TSUD_289480 [Trifolium subterraneum]|uniref:Uncharacterized protein n=1 Tax=Trifolium subterraneum TaxID=3900 RepID=A0A2Z6N5T5_TRISU|nr:hypothetical protein TSUD_289480 [Trifolium subterraneum]
MGSAPASLIASLKAILGDGPEDLLEKAEEFSSLVDSLREFSWRLNPQETLFLQRLLRLKAEVTADLPFIQVVEDAQFDSHEETTSLFEEIWVVKENMRMYENTLAAFFDEEDALENQRARLRGELADVEDKKDKLQEDIKADVSNLLEQRRKLFDLEQKQRAVDTRINHWVMKRFICPIVHWFLRVPIYPLNIRLSREIIIIPQSLEVLDLLASLIPQFPSLGSAKELSDSEEPLDTPCLGSRLERQIRSHYTRANRSLNDRGYIYELLGFPISSSNEEDSLESDSDSSRRSSDYVIISPSSFTGKGLVKYRPVVFEECSSGMETPSKYNSVESVRCFREVIKLYDGGDDAEVIVDPVGEGEFITTVNVGEPHYFYMYGAIIQTFNLWFPLTAFEIDVLRDSFLHIRCGPKLPDLMYDSERKPLFPFYWSADPRVVRGVDDLLLTPFERETVEFLDTFCLLDIKDVIRREKNPQGLVYFLKNMRRVLEEEWVSFLAKSKQKRLAPDASVDPLTQVIVEEGAPKGVKRKKRTKHGKGPTKIPKGNEGSSATVGEPAQRVKGGADVSESPKKSGYPLRSSGTGNDAKVANSDDGVILEKEKTSTQPPPSVQSPPVAEATPAAWGSDFDPSVFLDIHLAMKGDSAKFNSMGIAELRKLALGHELKGAVLNNLLSQRQERETREANERADRVAKTAEDVEQRYETAKSKLKEEKLASDNEKKVNALNEEIAKNCGRIEDLTTLRNQNIVALSLAGKQVAELEGEVEELEEDNSSLKETLTDKYLDGFLFDMEQVKLVFPDLDPELLAQVDVMKRIDGGQLVPR